MSRHDAPGPGFRGRGAADNPPNRFEEIAYLPDPAARDPDDPAPATRILRDTTRTIIARNQSPDVGFDASVNPYRGCEHGCSYCIYGDTPILMADGTTRPIAAVRKGDAIYGTRHVGHYRRYVRTTVLAHWSTRKPAYRITLADGTELVASGDHRFLTERGWKHVAGAGRGPACRPHLTLNNELRGTGRFATPPKPCADYERGYLCGMIRGDGTLGVYSYQRAGRARGRQRHFRLALADFDALDRTRRYLRDFGVVTREHAFANRLGRRTMRAIHSSARELFELIEALIAWPIRPSDAWCRGYLAGIFDAEGSFSSTVLRISKTDPGIIELLTYGLRRLGFSFRRERVTHGGRIPVEVVRLTGGLRAQLRFFHECDPAILRKRDIEGQALKSDADLRVAAIEPLGRAVELFDITTGTGDFIADGVVSHNCYARPFHEYLGFSAGLDFETKILAKTDAPELLRAELTKPSWTPQPIAMSGVTDAYQPVERRLRITRRCLEVLAEFRNPVSIITKSHLVTRDVDLLAELAEYGAAMVYLSVTSLDGALQRSMEPRAASPARRLAAIEALSRAGVPVGVLVAPVIPGLTDAELPAILRAAADAGARAAGYVVLRLPHGVAGLFEDWLERTFPDRREKVLNRLREIRGGELYRPGFHDRMRGDGAYAEQIRSLFRLARKRAGLEKSLPPLSTAAFRRPDPRGQLGLFNE